MISSRMPEGRPNSCPHCGKELKIEPSMPTGDAPCPHCGQLVWWPEGSTTLRQRVAKILQMPVCEVDVGSFNMGSDEDSLDTVEVVMELEEGFDLEILREDAAKIRSIEDVIRYLKSWRK